MDKGGQKIKKDEQIKSNLLTVFLIISIITIILMSFFIYHILKENDTIINKNIENIPTEDLFAIDYNSIKINNENPCLAKISNGDLYYLDTKQIDTIKYFLPSEEDYVKIDTNVKRIKSLTLGTDTSIHYLVIKIDGTVKLLRINTADVQYEIYEELKDYKIDDITGFDGETFTLKLLDGTTKNVKHFAGGAE
ncbi:MAG: hypothetical protein HFJ59_06315 [Clostridia bacterium]|nr:hypothetical protein [Clostridia bacterium]